ncbi:MAG: hypothetical protein WAM78_06915 [Candidatus Sulfotelmatobacter sp.]
MNTTSNESLGFGALLVLFGMLALYGGPSWLGWLIPAAVVLWLIASVRRQTRRTAIDARVDNRIVRR